ncbi:MAG: GNAT family N-acetyltransferase [Paracoccaceae bacterium]
MPASIAAENPLSADGRALIAASDSALQEVYPPEEIFSMDPAELAGGDAAFLVARDGAGAALGCVALVDCGDYGEVKRLFVPAEGRGRGVARALMARLEDEARARELRLIRLETGPRLHAAVALYRALGYTERGRFGDYQDHPASLFMEKAL